MTELEKHFKSADLIASEALGIALEKAKTRIQELERINEELKANIIKAMTILGTIDLSPATKEKNAMDRFKDNKI